MLAYAFAETINAIHMPNVKHVDMYAFTKHPYEAYVRKT